MLPNTEFKTIIDVVTRFPNEKACHQYLAVYTDQFDPS